MSNTRAMSAGHEATIEVVNKAVSDIVKTTEAIKNDGLWTEKLADKYKACFALLIECLKRADDTDFVIETLEKVAILGGPDIH